MIKRNMVEEKGATVCRVLCMVAAQNSGQTAFYVSRRRDLESRFCRINTPRSSSSDEFVGQIRLDRARATILDKIRFQSISSDNLKEYVTLFRARAAISATLITYQCSFHNLSN